jgi:hypothetical protein
LVYRQDLTSPKIIAQRKCIEAIGEIEDPVFACVKDKDIRPKAAVQSVTAGPALQSVGSGVPEKGVIASPSKQAVSADIALNVIVAFAAMDLI